PEAAALVRATAGRDRAGTAAPGAVGPVRGMRVVRDASYVPLTPAPSRTEPTRGEGSDTEHATRNTHHASLQHRIEAGGEVVARGPAEVGLDAVDAQAR